MEICGKVQFPQRSETLRKLCLSTKFPHQEIRRNYGILRSVIVLYCKRIIACFLVYVVTAASANEGSYACYFDPQLNVYLADCFSVNWLQDSDMVRFFQKFLVKYCF